MHQDRAARNLLCLIGYISQALEHSAHIKPMLVDSTAGFGFSTRLSALGCALVLSGLGTHLARVHASPAAGHAMAGRDGW